MIEPPAASEQQARAEPATLARASAHSRERRGLRTALRWMGLALLLLLFWGVRFLLPFRNWSIELDHSWQRAYAYFLEQRLQAGVDYVFTYGPLGALQTMIYHADLFWVRVLAWEGAFQLAASALLVRVWLRLPGLFDRALFAALVLLHGVVYELAPFVTITAAGALLLDPAPLARRWYVLCAVLLAGLALVKFNYLLLAGACTAAVAWDLARRRSGSAALRWVALVALAFLAGWIASGQALGNLPAYFSRSLAIVRGYSEAMGRPAPARGLALAAAIFALAAAHVFARWRHASPARAAEALLLATGLVFAFKSTFVQHVDSGTFFAFASLVPFFFAAPGVSAIAGSAPSRGGRAAIWSTKLAWVATALLGMPAFSGGTDKLRWAFERVGAGLAGTVDFLGGLEEQREKVLENDRALEKQFDLPRVREKIGKEPIDLLSVHQALLLVNGFTYRPRPVFQSYAAYTPELDALNGRFYESARAPRFVLVRLQPAAELLPAMEDGSVLRVLLRDYDPLFGERGFLLLERRPAGRGLGGRALEAPPVSTEPIERTLAFGERFELGPPPAGCRRIVLDIRPTWGGKARAFLLKAARVDLELALENGEVSSYRILPSLARSGMLLDPLIRSHDDLMRWYAGMPLGRAVALRVLVSDGERGFFEPAIRLRVELDLEVPPPEARPARPELAYTMFVTAPESVLARPPAHGTLQWNREVLLVGSPSTMTFAAGEGAHRLTAKFGILRKASLVGRTEGVRFRAVLRTAEGVEELLFERALDPRGDAEDVGMQDLEVEFAVSGPSQVLLTTEPRIPGKNDWNWAFWTEVRID